MEVYGHCVRLRPSVPFLPTTGSYNNAKIPEGICWTVSVPGHSPDERASICSLAAWGPSNGSFAVEKLFVTTTTIPKRSQIYEGNRWGFRTDGHVQQVKRHRISSYQQNRSNRGVGFGPRTAIRVKSFVDEATANSADTGFDSPSVTSERSDGERGESTLDSVDELQETEEEQEGEEEDNGRYSSGTEASEAGSTPSDYSYEDMKLDQRRNWSMVDMKKLDQLRNFEYRQSDEKGVFVVQTMRIEHMRVVQELLVDSFAELMGGLLAYRPLLALTVRQYVQDRFLCLPNVVTLVGLYAPAEEIGKMATSADDGNGSSASSMWRLAGTVELSFIDFGQPDVPAGPQPPHGSPYLCNMAVSRDYRRRGLGKKLIKAAEELTFLRGSQDLYLHCRLIDSAPLEMYKGAGFQIIATDSFLSFLSFQRRRHLMHKKLQLTSEDFPVQDGG